MTNYEMVKSEFDKIRAEGTPHLLHGILDHYHLVALDEHGCGVSTLANGHTHIVKDYVVMDKRRHVHDVAIIREKTYQVHTREEWFDVYCPTCGIEFMINEPSDAIPKTLCPDCGGKLDYVDYELWTTKYINNLPDSSFAWIAPGGKKDSEGKTTPRSLRHLPYKDSTGKVDAAHTRNALARLGQVKGMSESLQKSTRSKLEKVLQSTNKKDTQETADHESGVTGFTESFSAHNISNIRIISHTADGPPFVEIEGILFHEGIHKGKYFKPEDLKGATLSTRPGESLTYVDWNHELETDKRVGIITNIWWDDEAEWECPNNKTTGKGALMYRAMITESKAIDDISKGIIGNVSAELYFDTYFENNTEVATNINVVGEAITDTPALPAANIAKVCIIKDDERVCS